MCCRFWSEEGTTGRHLWRRPSGVCVRPTRALSRAPVGFALAVPGRARGDLLSTSISVGRSQSPNQREEKGKATWKGRRVVGWGGFVQYEVERDVRFGERGDGDLGFRWRGGRKERETWLSKEREQWSEGDGLSPAEKKGEERAEGERDRKNTEKTEKKEMKGRERKIWLDLLWHLICIFARGELRAVSYDPLGLFKWPHERPRLALALVYIYILLLVINPKIINFYSIYLFIWIISWLLNFDKSNRFVFLNFLLTPGIIRHVFHKCIIIIFTFIIIISIFLIFCVINIF
jgi:hypothetical protein